MKPSACGTLFKSTVSRSLAEVVSCLPISGLSVELVLLAQSREASRKGLNQRVFHGASQVDANDEML